MSSRQMLIRSTSPFPSTNKRRPVLNHSHSSASSTCSGRFAEVAGGTTAECAAICCCCPCGLVNLLILTMYKVPAGLCRLAWRRKKRQQLIKKGLLPAGMRRCKCGCDDTELQIHPMAGAVVNGVKFDDLEEKEEDEKAMVKLEKEMWETFYATGFWTSPSQREPPKKLTSSASHRETSNSMAPFG